MTERCKLTRTNWCLIKLELYMCGVKTQSRALHTSLHRTMVVYAVQNHKMSFIIRIRLMYKEDAVYCGASKSDTQTQRYKTHSDTSLYWWDNTGKPIHPLTRSLIFQGHRENREPSRADFRLKVGYTLSTTPIYCRVHIEKQTTIITEHTYQLNCTNEKNNWFYFVHSLILSRFISSCAF